MTGEQTAIATNAIEKRCQLIFTISPNPWAFNSGGSKRGAALSYWN